MFAAVFGFDMQSVRRLTQVEREGLEWLAASYLLSACLVCAPFGYAAWLGTQSLAVSVLLAAAGGGLLLAVLRLSIAGSGSAPLARALTSRSYAGPVLILALAAVLAAQPAQLLLRRQEAAGPVAARRQALIARHDASMREQGADFVEARGAELANRYRAQLDRCEFVGLRLQRLWSEPARAIRDTLLYVGLVLVFGVCARVAAGSALGSYERRCAIVTQRLIALDTEAAHRAVHTLLSAYDTYAPDPAGARVPLRTAWVVHAAKADKTPTKQVGR
jgi:hypothetical protein